MIIEAALIGLLCYLGALSSPWLLGLTGGWYLISRPLISGMLVGLILGFPAKDLRLPSRWRRLLGSPEPFSSMR